MKKKILSLILSLCMVMTMPVPINAATVSRPSNGSGGGGGFGSSAEPDVEENIIWKADEDSTGLTAGTMLADGLEVLFDTTYTAFTDEGGASVTRTIDGVEFTGYISHPTMNGGWAGTSINPDKSTALKYTAPADGALTVYLSDVGSTKVVCLGQDGMTKSDVEGAGVQGSGGDMAISYNVAADETYYVFVAGSKGHFCGVGFEAGAVAEETPVPTATPVVFPEPQYYLWGMTEAYSLCPANTELMTGLFTMFADTKGNGKYITSDANGRMTGGKAEGTALEYKAWTDGILTVSFTGLGADKTVYFVEEGGSQDMPLTSITNTSVDKIDDTISAEVSAGVTYYIYGAGTKACFNGAAFEPYDETATPEPTITPVPVPDVTDTPVITDAPVVTDVPVITDAPAVTDAPIFKPADVEMAYTIYDGGYVAVELNKPVEGKLIAAAYDSNGAMYNNFIIMPTDEECFTYEIPIPSGATTKFMLWESLWTMYPLANHEVIENTTGEGASLNAEYEADTNTVTYTVPTADVYSPMTVMIAAKEALESDFIRDEDIYYVNQDYTLSGQALLNESLPDGSYLVRVGYYNDGVYCISEEELTVIGCIFPIGEVENVKHEINGNRLNLTWDAASGATHYAIYDEGGELKALVTEPSWSVVMADEGVYVYTIKSAAINGDEYIMSEGVTVEVEFRIDKYTEGHYTYTVNDGKATITGCSTDISGDIEIPSTLGGYPVTAIDDYAFLGCKKLTGVVIPDSVVSIGYNAFAECDMLASVEMSDNVTELGEYAFAWCPSLTEITLSSGIKSIGNSTFYMCEALKSITIPDGVESIGDNAFEYCKALESVELPETLKSMGRYAFSSCAIKSIKLPGSLESVGAYAFSLCPNLASVVISDGTTAIEYGAFWYCDKLAAVTIPASVTTIGYLAFNGCRSLAAVYYAASEDEWNAIEIEVENTPIAEADIYYNGAVSTGKCGDNLTWEFDGSTLTISGTGDMWDCDAPVDVPWCDLKFAIENVVIESGITSIAENSFHYCTNLKEVQLPEGVESIGEHAFFVCESLTSITLPDSITSLGGYAFSDCIALESIVIPEGVSVINERLFRRCSSLKYITIPSGVTEIITEAFGGCTALEEVTILSKTVKLNNSFDSRIESLTIKGYAGSTAEAYASEKSYNFVALEEPTPEPTATPAPTPTPNPTGDCGDSLRWRLEDGTLTISGKGDMWDCYVGMAAQWYKYRNDIKNIVIGSGVTSIGSSAFSGCEYAVSVTIPEGVTDIGDAAFFQCYRLTDVEIPDSVVTIGNSAFDLCDSLPRITIPASVESIGNYAFDGSVALEEVTILSKTVSFGEHVFSGYASNFKINGYAGSTAQAYANEYRYKFVALEEPTPEPTEVPTPEPTAIPTPEPTEVPGPGESYTINSVTLEAEDGTSLSEAPMNTAFIVNVEFTKNLAREQKDYMFVAVYDTDGALLSIDYIKADFAKDSTYEAGFHIAAQAKPIGQIKAFVWDSFNSAQPLAESKVIK